VNAGIDSPRRLDLGAIQSTADRLQLRIHDRFPDRGIDKISQDLVSVSRETQHRLDHLHQPRWILRASLGTLVAVSIVCVVGVALVANLRFHVDGLPDWLDVFQNEIQDLVYVGIAGLFFAGAERRMQRCEILAGLHELRSVAHVIDMHQLTKDPRSVTHPEDRVPHSPERSDDAPSLFHYLDYCSEMLSICNKLAALYAQESQDPVVLSSVSNVQDLTTALSNKIWQKIMILNSAQPAR
jgi:hypothetical protein